MRDYYGLQFKEISVIISYRQHFEHDIWTWVRFLIKQYTRDATQLPKGPLLGNPNSDNSSYHGQP